MAINYINLRYIFNQIQKDETPKTTYEYDMYRDIQNYIYNNPDNEDVIAIKKWFLDYYSKPFMNSEFLDILNSKELLKYEKRHEIFKHFPFVNTNSNFYMFYVLVMPSNYFGSFSNFINGCFYYFEQMNKKVLDDSTINQIKQYLIDNEKVMKFSKDSYLPSFLDTMREYRKALIGIFEGDAYLEFSDSAKYFDGHYHEDYEEYKIKNQYKNKLLGNLGEYYFYENNQRHKPLFVARDLGNGFGYDAYYKENGVENLYEVKATSRTDGKDVIVLSDTEYDVMKENEGNNLVNYRVNRVFIDNPNSYTFYSTDLKSKNNMLVSNDLEYGLVGESYGKYTYEQSNKSKQKTLELFNRKKQ